MKELSSYKAYHLRKQPTSKGYSSFSGWPLYEPGGGHHPGSTPSGHMGSTGANNSPVLPRQATTLHQFKPQTNSSPMVPFFFPQRSPIPHLCFIHTFMLDTIVSDCPAAAICHMATKSNRILVRRFDPFCYTTHICL